MTPAVLPAVSYRDGRRRVKAKYFTQRGADQWVFHGKVVDGLGNLRPIYLYKTAQTVIRRHVQVRGLANPYDPACESYFEERLSVKMAGDLRRLRGPGWDALK